MKQNSTSSDIRAGSSQPELFTADGHLTDLAFKLLIDEQLDSLQSLEVSEHLSFCDRCPGTLYRDSLFRCSSRFGYRPRAARSGASDGTTRFPARLGHANNSEQNKGLLL